MGDFKFFIRNNQLEVGDNFVHSKEFHFRRTHLFINFSFRGFRNRFNIGKGFERYIAKDHRVHIYFSVDDYIDNDLYEFVRNCKYKIDNPVTFHISKRDKWIKEKLETLLADLDNWLLIPEKQVLATPYLYEKDVAKGRTYLVVYYFYKDKGERIRTAFHHSKISI